MDLGKATLRIHRDLMAESANCSPEAPHSGNESYSSPLPCNRAFVSSVTPPSPSALLCTKKWSNFSIYWQLKSNCSCLAHSRYFLTKQFMEKHWGTHVWKIVHSAERVLIFFGALSVMTSFRPPTTPVPPV